MHEKSSRSDFTLNGELTELSAVVSFILILAIVAEIVKIRTFIQLIVESSRP